MPLLDGLEHLLGDALIPLEEADRLLGEAIDKIGQGVTFAGDEASKFGEYIAGLEAKIAALAAKLKAS